jgi:hypothetical protein
MTLDEKDLEAIVRTREVFGRIPPADLEELRRHVPETANLYQFWIEVQLLFAERWKAELTYQRDAWAAKYKDAILRLDIDV